jgi:hypothetical protein
MLNQERLPIPIHDREHAKARKTQLERLVAVVVSRALAFSRLLFPGQP